MPDHYAQTSFLIPCTQEQAEIALRALDHIDGEFDEYAIQTIEKSESDDLDAEEKILRHCYENHTDHGDALSMDPQLYWGFCAAKDDEGIWVHHDESVDTDLACTFAQAVLIAFDLPTVVTLEVGYTCSKPCLDSFGGTAVAVTKDDIRHCDTYSFIHMEREAAAKRERYFLAKIAGVNGGCQGQFVFKVTGEQSVSDRFQEIMLDYSADDEGGSDSERGLNPLGDVSADRASHVLLTPSEFNTMSRHLPIH